jgi:hypothetical protein
MLVVYDGETSSVPILQVLPASSETKTLSSPLLTTPTKIRGVALPDEPEEGSNVIQARPIISELYPLVSLESGMKVP